MPAQATADNKCRALLTAYINIKTPKVMKKTILALLAVILPMLAAAQVIKMNSAKICVRSSSVSGLSGQFLS